MSKQNGKRGVSLIVIIILFALSGAIMFGGYLGVKALTDKVFKDMTVDVDFEDEDVESAYDKLNLVYDEDTPNLNDVIFGRFDVSDEAQAVDFSLSNEEITALFDDMSDKDDFIQNVRFQALDDDEFEVSFTIDNVKDMLDEAEEKMEDFDEYEDLIQSVEGLVENQTIYYTGTLEYDEDAGFVTDFGALRVGPLPIPEEQGQEIADQVSNYLGELDDMMEAFDIEDFEITDDGLDFIGTIPTDIDSK